LHLKAVPFEYVSIRSLASGKHQKINPQGLMPALEMDGVVVAQSMAILELIEEKFPTPPLLPEAALARAAVRSFAQLIVSDLHPLNNNRVRSYLADPMERSESQISVWYKHWVGTALSSLEEMLARQSRRGQYCFGDSPTYADLCLVPQLHNCRRFDCDLTPYPLLLAAENTCRNKAAFQAAAPERLPDFRGQVPPWL